MSGTADEVVLDANVFVGLADDRDTLHVRARELHARLDAQGVDMVLVDFLVAEALSVIHRPAGERTGYMAIDAPRSLHRGWKAVQTQLQPSDGALNRP